VLNSSGIARSYHERRNMKIFYSSINSSLAFRGMSPLSYDPGVLIPQGVARMFLIFSLREGALPGYIPAWLS